MDNLITEINARLQSIIDDLKTIKDEYDKKLFDNNRVITKEFDKVKKYKEEFFETKNKITKMNEDINGFQRDYQNLVDRFKDDELSNILIAANKEVSTKIEERKRKIVHDQKSMNELVVKAENAKKALVKLNAEKHAFELCLTKINDAYTFYGNALSNLINYANENPTDLASYFDDNNDAEQSNRVSQEVLDDTNDIDINIDDMINDDIVDESNMEVQENEVEIDSEKEENTSTDNEDDSTSTLETEKTKETIDYDSDVDMQAFNLDDSIEDDDSLYNIQKED